MIAFSGYGIFYIANFPVYGTQLIVYFAIHIGQSEMVRNRLYIIWTPYRITQEDSLIDMRRIIFASHGFNPVGMVIATSSDAASRYRMFDSL